MAPPPAPTKTGYENPLIRLLQRPGACRGFSGPAPCTCPHYDPTPPNPRLTLVDRLTWSCDRCDHAHALHSKPVIRSEDDIRRAEKHGKDLVERCHMNGCACPCFASYTADGLGPGEECYLCGDPKRWHRPPTMAIKPLDGMRRSDGRDGRVVKTSPYPKPQALPFAAASTPRRPGVPSDAPSRRPRGHSPSHRPSARYEVLPRRPSASSEPRSRQPSGPSDEAFFDAKEDQQDPASPAMGASRFLSFPPETAPSLAASSPSLSSSSTFARSPASTSRTSIGPTSQPLSRRSRSFIGPDDQDDSLETETEQVRVRKLSGPGGAQRLSDLVGAITDLQGIIQVEEDPKELLDLSHWDLSSLGNNDDDDADEDPFRKSEVQLNVIPQPAARTVGPQAEQRTPEVPASPFVPQEDAARSPDRSPPKLFSSPRPASSTVVRSPSSQASIRPASAADHGLSPSANPRLLSSPIPRQVSSISRPASTQTRPSSTASSVPQPSEVFYPSGVNAGSSSSKKTIAAAVTPSPSQTGFKPGDTVNVVVFLPGKIRADSFTAIVVNVVGTSHVPGEPPDTHVFYFETTPVHPTGKHGSEKATREGERWTTQIKIPESTNCRCHLPGQGALVPDSSMSQVNSIKYTIEVKAKRKEKLAANPKIVIPIRIRRPTRLALTAQLQKSGTHRRSTDGEVSIDGEWMTVEAAQPVDGIDCMLGWRIENDALAAENVVMHYRIILPLSPASALSAAAPAMLNSARISVGRRTTLRGTEGGRKGKKWVLPTVAVRVKSSEKGEVHLLPDDAGYEIRGSMKIGKIDLRTVDVCNAEIDYSVTAHLTHAMLSKPLRAYAVLPTVHPLSLTDDDCASDVMSFLTHTASRPSSAAGSYRSGGPRRRSTATTGGTDDKPPPVLRIPSTLIPLGIGNLTFNRHSRTSSGGGSRSDASAEEGLARLQLRSDDVGIDGGNVVYKTGGIVSTTTEIGAFERRIATMVR